MTSKWAEIRAVNQCARKFAREILSDRFQAVVDTIPLAAHHYGDDIEHVHLLRVNCRRCRATLDALAPLSKGKLSPLKKWLKEVRRAAGPARDADVMLERFHRERISPRLHEFILTRLLAQRAEAQTPLVELANGASPEQLEKILQKALAAFTVDEGDCATPSVAEFASGALTEASANFLQLAATPVPTLTELHELRIAGKRLRYSIEIFHAVFPDELRDKVYPMLTRVQDRLGKINDHVTAQQLFQGWLADMEPDELAAQLAQQISDEYDEAAHLRATFLRSWTNQGLKRFRKSLRKFVSVD